MDIRLKQRCCEALVQHGCRVRIKVAGGVSNPGPGILLNADQVVECTEEEAEAFIKIAERHFPHYAQHIRSAVKKPSH